MREISLPGFQWSPEQARGSCDGERETERLETERVSAFETEREREKQSC